LLQDGGLTALCVATNFVPMPLPYIACAGIDAHTTASQPRWSPPDHSSRRNPLGRRAPRLCSGPNLHQWVAAILVSAICQRPRSSPPTPVAEAAEDVSCHSFLLEIKIYRLKDKEEKQDISEISDQIQKIQINFKKFCRI
jgi:hypothetical protein